MCQVYGLRGPGRAQKPGTFGLSAFIGCREEEEEEEGGGSGQKLKNQGQILSDKFFSWKVRF